MGLTDKWFMERARLVLLLILVSLCHETHAQTVHSWSKAFGGTPGAAGLAVAVDSENNIIVTGIIRDSVDFGGGPLAHISSDDIFVAKFDPSGNHLWSISEGAGNGDIGKAIALDSSDNIWVTGVVDNSAGSSQDLFILNLDKNGNTLSNVIYAPGGPTTGEAIAPDSLGNVYVTGLFSQTLTFPGKTLTSLSTRSVYLVKLNPAGIHLWSKVFGSSVNDRGRGLKVDSQNNLLITGSFGSTIDLGGGDISPVGGTDIFLAKFDASGTHLWSKGIGGTGGDDGQALDTDSLDNVAITGFMRNSVDFGGGPISGVLLGTAYSAKFDSSGAHLWSQTHSGSESSNGLAIRFDKKDDLVLAGTRDSVAFVTKLDGAGNILADNTFGTQSWIHGLSSDAIGRIVLTGRFVNSIDFGGGTLFPDSTDAMFLASLFVGDLYVDFSRIVNGDGSEIAPFNNLTDAVASAGSGSTIAIAPETSDEIFTGIGAIDKPLVLINSDAGSGSVTVGETARRRRTPSGFTSRLSKDQ